MATITLPYDFVGGTRAIADQVDANFAALVNAFGPLPNTLTGPTTFYVAPNGSDTTGNGLSPTSPAASVTYIYTLLTNTYNINGQNVLIQLANGTYNQTVTMGGLLTGQQATIQLTVQGNMAAPNLVTIIGDPCFNITAGAQVVIQGLTVQSTVSNGFQCHYHGRIRFQNCIFGPCTGHQMLAARAGSIQSIGNYTISGGALSHANSIQGGQIFIDTTPLNYMVATPTGSPTVTVTGTPNFSQAFIRAANESLVQVGAAFSPATGSATGVRSLTNFVSTINTFGQGIPLATSTYLPGNAPGTDSNGGVTG